MAQAHLKRGISNNCVNTCRTRFPLYTLRLLRKVVNKKKIKKRGKFLIGPFDDFRIGAIIKKIKIKNVCLINRTRVHYCLYDFCGSPLCALGLLFHRSAIYGSLSLTWDTRPSFPFPSVWVCTLHSVISFDFHFSLILSLSFLWFSL